MVSGTRCPYVSVCGCEVVKGAAAPKGPMTYAVFIWASRMELGPGGWNWGLEAKIGASGLGLEPRGWDQSLQGGRDGEGEEEERGENLPYVREHRS